MRGGGGGVLIIMNGRRGGGVGDYNSAAWPDAHVLDGSSATIITPTAKQKNEKIVDSPCTIRAQQFKVQQTPGCHRRLRPSNNPNEM